MKLDNIIADLELTYGTELDNNFELTELCNGDTCRHNECICWKAQEKAIEKQLLKQLGIQVEPTYQPTPERNWDYMASFIDDDPELQRTGLGKDVYSAYKNLTDAFEREGD